MAISMTGFGAADAQWETWSCQVEIRSVNQRFLDIRCRLPLGFQTMEPEIKKQIKAICTRGKIDCSIRLEKDAGEEKLQLNPERAKSYNELLKEFETLSGRKVSVDARDLSSINIIEENKSGEKEIEIVFMENKNSQAGTYCLRTNRTDLDAKTFWKTYCFMFRNFPL
ncbi:MAG TPA: hypothetical protein EYN57_01305, partial [Candidatus Lambdaproteobacteria bacterium]|nr:hypothetical protein [Candidatus Lambdaproteobacteria bacterium]